MIVLDKDYVVDAAGLLTLIFATRLLSGMKCEVMFHHAKASLQWFIIVVSFV
jgi:hypothetical protein